jgi:hypothetical protein
MMPAWCQGRCWAQVSAVRPQHGAVQSLQMGLMVVNKHEAAQCALN